MYDNHNDKLTEYRNDDGAKRLYMYLQYPQLRPEFYNVKSLTGLGLVPDLIFHITYLIIFILVVIYIASKIFEREGIVN